MLLGPRGWVTQITIVFVIVSTISVASWLFLVLKLPWIHSLSDLYTKERKVIIGGCFMYSVIGLSTAAMAWLSHTQRLEAFPVSIGVALFIIAGLLAGIGLGTRNIDVSTAENPERAPIFVILIRGSGWVVAGTAAQPILTPYLF